MKEQTSESPETETMTQLLEHKNYFERQAAFGQSRRLRLEERMLRKSTAKLSTEKRERMVRRHMAAITQFDNATHMLDQVNFRIQQITNVEAPAQ